MTALAHEPVTSDFRSTLCEAIYALYEAHHGLGVLALASCYLAGGLGEPRDLACERTAIAYFMCDWIEPHELAGLDWAPRHARLVDALLSMDRSSPALIEELTLRTYRELRARPLNLARALAGAIRGLDKADEPELVLLRLHALQRQRRALAAVLGAVRELRSSEGNHDAVHAHLADAMRQLEGK
jgi:hypothetical protein